MTAVLPRASCQVDAEQPEISEANEVQLWRVLGPVQDACLAADGRRVLAGNVCGRSD